VLKDYLKGIFETAQRGDAREKSYYPDLKALLEAVAHSSGNARAHVTVLPKKTEAGNLISGSGMASSTLPATLKPKNQPKRI